jgi:hypothetical protein
MRAIRFSLLVTAACGTLATGAYFVFRDDLSTRLIGHQTQTQINYEEKIADLRAQIDRVSRLDQERVEQQIKPLLRRQMTLEEVTSGLAKELSIQARNSLPPSGTIGTGSLLSSVEAASAAIVATSHAESAKQANQATIRDKKPRRPHWKHVRVKRKRVQESWPWHGSDGSVEARLTTGP